MTSKKIKIGALGPQAHWLKLVIADRALTKRYIKESVQGWTRPDGVRIPGLRQVYKGFSAKDGYDLTHIERWSKARLEHAREYAQMVNTLTSRPFQVLSPHTKKQLRSAQYFTGQDLPRQRVFIVQVQDPLHDTIHFKKNKVIVERKLRDGSKIIKQRYLFIDYLRWTTSKGEEREDDYPITFRQMKKITKHMLNDMPEFSGGNAVYYTLTSVQFGPIGNVILKKDVLNELERYHFKYDSDRNKEGFSEEVIGFTSMTGTQATNYIAQSDQRRAERRRMYSLRFKGGARRRLRMK